MTSINRLFTAFTVLSIAVLTFKKSTKKVDYLPADLSSLENFKKSILEHRAHGLSQLVQNTIKGESIKTEDNKSSKDQLVFFISPMMFTPMVIFFDGDSNFKAVTLDFHSQLTTFTLPLLLRGVKNIQKPSPAEDRLFDSVLTQENKFECHSFFDDGFKCFIVKDDDQGRALYIRVVQTFNMITMAELSVMKKDPTFDMSKAIKLPVGFEYSETFMKKSPFAQKDVIGIAPVKKNGKLTNIFLETVFAHSKSANENFKIASMPAQRVRIWLLDYLPYDVIFLSFETGVDEDVESYDVVGELKQESKHNGGKFYMEVDKVVSMGQEVEGIKKLQYNPSLPGYGLPKHIIEEMMKVPEYKISLLGVNIYIVEMETDDQTKVEITIGEHTMELTVSDAVATWTNDDNDKLKAIVILQSIPENDTVELGYLAVRRHSILVDIEKGMMGFKKDN